MTYSKFLVPFSTLYGWGVHFRNWLYDKDLLHSREWAGPIVCVGNLTVGGTGKTPMAEYLVRLLEKDGEVTVLSRGYKRQTKGFVKATARSTAQEIGDEPWQMKHKFPNIEVCVCKDRNEGLERIFSQKASPWAVILDDAFQHRKVKTGMNILLTDYNRLISRDRMLPAGRLRDDFAQRLRAQIIIVTKCPGEVTAEQCNSIVAELKLHAQQKVFFATTEYGSAVSVFDPQKEVLPLEELAKSDGILMLTGIARPEQLEAKLKRLNKNVHPLCFPDHHAFSDKDQQLANSLFEKMEGENKVIVTTEKDAARLQHCSKLSGVVKERLYALPIQTRFLNNGAEAFNNIIEDYVRKNQRNG